MTRKSLLLMIKNLQTIRFITVSSSQAAAGSATNPRKELARVVEKTVKIVLQNFRIVTLLLCDVEGSRVCCRNGWYVGWGRWAPAKAR